MATHSSIPPWRTPWTEEPGRLVYGVTQIILPFIIYSVKHLDTNKMRPQERKSSIKTEIKQKFLQIKQLSDIELKRIIFYMLKV